MQNQSDTISPPSAGGGASRGAAALLAYFNQVKQQIIDAATQKGMNATGNTLASLEVVETEQGYELQASPNIYVMENGRGPTSPGAAAGNPDLVQIIQEWLDARGLGISPYAVANAIHKNGTRLYQAGGNSGVLSVPLNLDTLDQVFDGISSDYLDDATKELGDCLDQNLQN